MTQTDPLTLPNKPLFWVSEAAHYLGVSYMTVYRRIEAGIIPTHLKGKPYKIPREALVKLLSQDSQD